MSDKATWIEQIEKAVTEMKEKQVVLLKRGDLIKEEQIPLYKEAIQELEATKWFLQYQDGLPNYAYRYLQMNVFMRHESFFMDLFETNEFPLLFELFELE